MRSMRNVIVLAMFGLVVALVARPLAQGGGGGQALMNIKVLPKEWTRQQVTAYMQTIGPALGVMCNHCHVSTQDRASDEKPAKLVARKMIAMVMDINDKYLKGVGEEPAAGASKVTCYTCHRGALKPLTKAAAGGL